MVDEQSSMAMENCWKTSVLVPNDFTDTLPYSLSEDIFTLLDVPSLCHATEVSTRWNTCINFSNYIWRKKYYDLSPRLLKEIPHDSLTWKDMVIDEYLRQLCKRSWMRGDYSYLKSYKDLDRRTKWRPLSVEDWAEILEKELYR